MITLSNYSMSTRPNIIMLQRLVNRVTGGSSSSQSTSSGLTDADDEHALFTGTEPLRRTMPDGTTQEAFTMMPLNYFDRPTITATAQFVQQVEEAVSKGERGEKAEESRLITTKLLRTVPVQCKVRNGRFLDPNEAPCLSKEGFGLYDDPLDPRTFGDDHSAFMSDGFVTAHYYPQMAELVKRATGAQVCMGIHHVVRTSDPNIKNQVAAAGGKTENPAPGIHTDYSAADALDMYDRLVTSEAIQHHLTKAGYTGKTAKDVKRVQFVNCWRSIAPLSKPILRDHLAMCDQQSVVAPDDMVVVPKYDGGKWKEGVRLNAKFANHRPHRWFYYPGMLRSEVLVFTQFDSASHIVDGSLPPHSLPRMCFHTAASGTHPVPEGYKRISMEFRAVAIFIEGGGRGCPVGAVDTKDSPATGAKAILRYMLANHDVKSTDVLTWEEKELVAGASDKLVSAMVYCDQWDLKGRTFLSNHIGMGPGYRLDKVRTVVNTVVDVGVEMGTLSIPKTTRRAVVNHVKHHILTNHVDKFVANTRIGLSKAGGAAPMLFAAEQAHLQSMGFTDTVRNAAALRRTQGNVQGAVDLLV